MSGCAGHQADTLQLGGSDCTLEVEILAWRRRLDPGGSDCIMEAQAPAWRLRLRPGVLMPEAQIAACRLRLETQIGTWNLNRLSGLCRAVPACGVRHREPFNNLTSRQLDWQPVASKPEWLACWLAGLLACWLSGLLAGWLAG